MTNKTSQDEFYIGYLDTVPESVKKYVKKVIFIIIGVVILLAILVPIGWNTLFPAKFDFFNTTTYTGTLITSPYPILMTPDQDYLLVAPGKHGANHYLKDLNSTKLTLNGKHITRDNQHMIEIDPRSIVIQSALAKKETNLQDLGVHTLTGEIVDSKCFLGVMNPGNLKPHKACATLCIRGGIPPVLVVKHTDGAPSYYLLVDTYNQPVNQQVLDLVAQPIQVTGRVLKAGSFLILQQDPSQYAKL